MGLAIFGNRFRVLRVTMVIFGSDTGLIRFFGYDERLLYRFDGQREYAGANGGIFALDINWRFARGTTITYDEIADGNGAYATIVARIARDRRLCIGDNAPEVEGVIIAAMGIYAKIIP